MIFDSVNVSQFLGSNEPILNPDSCLHSTPDSEFFQLDDIDIQGINRRNGDGDLSPPLAFFPEDNINDENLGNFVATTVFGGCVTGSCVNYCFITLILYVVA